MILILFKGYPGPEGPVGPEGEKVCISACFDLDISYFCFCVSVPYFVRIRLLA